MLDRIRIFLGAERLRLLLALLIGTGALSIGVGFVQAEWTSAVQTLLAFAFLLGAMFIILGRLGADERNKWLAIAAPAIGLLLIGALFFPDSLGFFVGGAVGWTIVGALIFGRTRAPMQYRLAVKALRKNDFETAIKEMDSLIKAEPNEANHYRFRAELLRLSGKLPRARKDYDKMREIAQDEGARAVAYNGLAEIDLQAKQYDSAHRHALQAYALAPQDWVTAYNLGMIEDRLGLSEAVLETLTHKLKARVPDARHRLLIALYLTRAQSLLGDVQGFERALAQLKRERDGLREWETLLKSEQAGLLREALSADIQTVQQLLAGQLSMAQLAQGSQEGA